LKGDWRGSLAEGGKQVGQLKGDTCTHFARSVQQRKQLSPAEKEQKKEHSGPAARGGLSKKKKKRKKRFFHEGTEGGEPTRPWLWECQAPRQQKSAGSGKKKKNQHNRKHNIKTVRKGKKGEKKLRRRTGEPRLFSP